MAAGNRLGTNDTFEIMRARPRPEPEFMFGKENVRVFKKIKDLLLNLLQAAKSACTVRIFLCTDCNPRMAEPDQGIDETLTWKTARGIVERLIFP